MVPRPEHSPPRRPPEQRPPRANPERQQPQPAPERHPDPDGPRTRRSPKHAARDALEQATPGELGIDSIAMLVLFKLVGRLNHKAARTSCWPKQPRLAKDTGIPVRTLKRVIARLETSGLMKVHVVRGRGQPNEYVIDVDELCRRAGVAGSSRPVQRELGPFFGSV